MQYDLQAYVIHRRAYRDTSLLVDIFSESEGRLTLIAKGAKRAKSPLRAILQMFQPLKLSCFGRSDLLTLKTAEPIVHLNPIQGQQLAWGFYLNELLYNLLGKHEAFPYVYQQYHNLIQKLTEKTIIEADLRYFELELLKRLGYGLPIYQTLDGEPIIAEQSYRFEIESGLTPTSLNDQRTNVFLGTHIQALTKQNLCEPEALLTAKRLLRLAIQHTLAGKPLRSRELIV